MAGYQVTPLTLKKRWGSHSYIELSAWSRSSHLSRLMRIMSIYDRRGLGLYWSWSRGWKRPSTISWDQNNSTNEYVKQHYRFITSWYLIQIRVHSPIEAKHCHYQEFPQLASQAKYYRPSGPLKKFQRKLMNTTSPILTVRMAVILQLSRWTWSVGISLNLVRRARDFRHPLNSAMGIQLRIWFCTWWRC